MIIDRTWTDVAGDTIQVATLVSDPRKVAVRSRQGRRAEAAIYLDREQVLDLYQVLGDHLMATTPVVELARVVEPEMADIEHNDAAALLMHALNAASIDALANTSDNDLLAKLLDTWQGRELIERATPAVQVPTETITAEAERAVYGDRQDDYGHPRQTMTRQAIIWTGLLHHKLADGVHLEPEDVARCMIGVKLARDVHAPKRDNRVDGAGFFLCLDRLETGR